MAFLIDLKCVSILTNRKKENYKMKKLFLITGFILLNTFLFLSLAYSAEKESLKGASGAEVDSILSSRFSNIIYKKDIMQYVPGQLLIKYEFINTNTKKPRGKEIFEEYKKIAESISKTFDLKVKAFKPVHQYLVSKMTQDNLTEVEVRKEASIQREKKYQERLKKKDLTSSKESYIDNFEKYNLARTLLLTLKTDKDVLRLSKQINGQLLYLDGIEVKLTVEPNYLAQATFVPNDPLYPQQWAHQNTQAELGWDIERGEPSVVIAVIDTGLAYYHEDLTANILPWGTRINDFVDIDLAAYPPEMLVPGEDYIDPDSDPSDFNGHGTFTTGIACAVGNNSIGVAGVSHSCSIMPVRAGFSINYPFASALFEYDDIANAIDYAALNSADIINMSFGSGYTSEIMIEAINYAYDVGVLLIAAAGNIPISFYSYPASYENVMSIAATTIDDYKASFSTWGDQIDVCAPGVDILSTAITGYNLGSGTSASSAYVAGLAGLILSHYPERSRDEIWGTIINTADDISALNPNYGPLLGWGRVNVYQALSAPMAPNIDIDFTYSELRGNNNQIIEPRETASLVITLENFWEEITNVSATLSTQTPGVTITQANSNFRSLNFMHPVNNSEGPFIFSIDNSVYIVNFTLHIMSPSYSEDINFDFTPLINVPSGISTIQGAINAATDGTVILVAPGTYFEQINLMGKKLLLASRFILSGNKNDIISTILDGNLPNGGVVTFNSQEGADTKLIGFTITGGQTVGFGVGGGIFCNFASSPTLSDLIIENNSAYAGGGLGCRNLSHPTLQNALISNNSAIWGGGIDGEGNSNPNLRNIKISDNTAEGGGGALHIYNDISGGTRNVYYENIEISDNTSEGEGGGICWWTIDSLILKDSVIFNNISTQGYGGGIMASSFETILENVTVTANTASSGSGIYFYPADGIGGNIKNSIIWGNNGSQIYPPYDLDNFSLNYSDVQNATGQIWFENGEGNIDANPLFVDPINSNYHLTVNSPCIDAGDPLSPLDPDHTRADMGAYYFDQSLGPGIIPIYPVEE